MLHANFMAVCFVEPGLLPVEVLYCGNGDFPPLLLLWPRLWQTTFVYKLDLYSVEIYYMCQYELPTSRLSKVIVWQTDRHAQNFIPCHFLGVNKNNRLTGSTATLKRYLKLHFSDIYVNFGGLRTTVIANRSFALREYEIPWERVPYLSSLEVCSQQGTIQIRVYLTLGQLLTPMEMSKFFVVANRNLIRKFSEKRSENE